MPEGGPGAPSTDTSPAPTLNRIDDADHVVKSIVLKESITYAKRDGAAEGRERRANPAVIAQGLIAIRQAK